MAGVGALEEAVATMRSFVAALEPGCYSGADALSLLSLFVEAERVATAGRTLMARRVERANAWRDSGERSAAHFLAHATGTTVAKAEETLDTARRLEALPATADAFRSGSLSETQTTEVAAAAAQSPSSESALLATAERSTVKQLRNECRRVRLAATDQRATYERIKAERHLVTWTDHEGAYCGRFRTTPDAGARILAGLDAEIERGVQRRPHRGPSRSRERPTRSTPWNASSVVEMAGARTRLATWRSGCSSTTRRCSEATASRARPVRSPGSARCPSPRWSRGGATPICA